MKTSISTKELQTVQDPVFDAYVNFMICMAQQQEISLQELLQRIKEGKAIGNTCMTYAELAQYYEELSK